MAEDNKAQGASSAPPKPASPGPGTPVSTTATAPLKPAGAPTPSPSGSGVTKALKPAGATTTTPAASQPRPVKATALDDKPGATRTSARHVTDEPPVSMPSVNVPPRPDRTEGAEGLSAQFAQVRQKLDAILGESSSRLLELKVASAEGLDRAVQKLEAEAKRVREHLERNEALAREAERAAGEARQLETMQDELEASVAKVQGRVQKLVERANELRTIRATLEQERNELEAKVNEKQEKVTQLRLEVDRLGEREDGLERECDAHEKIRTRLEENVSRLERLRDEYAAAIKRLKDTKEDLTKPPGG